MQPLINLAQSIFGLLLLWSLTAGVIHAQTEAQAAEDFFEFQHSKNPQRTIEIHPGDRIRLPAALNGKKMMTKGTVMRLDTSTFEVQMDKTEEVLNIDLSTVPFFQKENSGLFVTGIVLVCLSGIIFLYSALVFTIAIVFSLAFGGLGAVLALGFLILVFNPFMWLLLGPGIWMIKRGRRKISPQKWPWKRKRRVIVQQEK